jgi:energy-coupling factor transporter ATP-binding protein EcfA2
MALLEIRDLSTDIALSRSVVHALDQVSLTLEAGRTLGIVGESGCGKTMTAMSIEQLLPPGGRIVGGEIRFDGRDLVGLPERELNRIRGRSRVPSRRSPPAASTSVPSQPSASRANATASCTSYGRTARYAVSLAACASVAAAADRDASGRAAEHPVNASRTAAAARTRRAPAPVRPITCRRRRPAWRGRPRRPP